jgi:GNAT superfamily N-acetyltransferase
MSAPVVVERADASSVVLALPLLEVQFQEHTIDVGGARLERALRGLVEVPGRGAVVLARAGSETVGVAVLAYTWTLEHGGKCTWLDELYVVPEHRGRGVGRALLRRATEIARAEGCAAIDLEVDAEHARAETLYLREGFYTLPRRRFARVL